MTMLRRSSALSDYERIGGQELVEAVLRCEAQLRRYDARYSASRTPRGEWIMPGSVRQSHEVEVDQGARFDCLGGMVSLRWLTADALSIKFSSAQESSIQNPSQLNVDDLPSVPVTFEALDDSIELRTPAFICRVTLETFSISLLSQERSLLCGNVTVARGREANGTRISLALQTSESGHGLGARAGLNLRGKQFPLWNAPLDSANTASSFSVPFYLGIHDNGVYGLFCDTASRGRADIGSSSREELTIEHDDGECSYVLIVGYDVPTVVGRLTELSGEISMPPLWALGYQHLVSAPLRQNDVLALAADLRQRSIPCDVLLFDLDAQDRKRALTWHGPRFPSVISLIDTLHEQSFRVVASVQPGVTTDDTLALFTSGQQEDVFLRFPDAEPFTAATVSGVSSFPNYSEKQSRDWWTHHVAAWLLCGVDGIVARANEPTIYRSDHPDTLPEYLFLTTKSAQNDYAVAMAHANHDALEIVYPERRPFNVLSAGGVGAQRVGAATVVTDTPDWAGLRSGLSRALNLALSGVSFVGLQMSSTPITIDDELLTRWLQVASLLPLCQGGGGTAELWQREHSHEIIHRLTLQLRYRLLPYLYSMIALYREFGWSIVRPVLTAEPRPISLSDDVLAYRVGEALLVAPVLAGGVLERDVVLPLGEWYDFWTFEQYRGGQTIRVRAPLERLPMFVRAGMTLPMWSEVVRADASAIKELTLRVFPGFGESALYEDAGDGLAYRDGEYRWVYITCGWEENALVVRRRVAGRYEPHYHTIRVEIVGLREEPQEVRVDRYGAPVWFYDQGVLEIVTTEPFSQAQVIFGSAG